jgi:uncharacterized protein (TIGR00369 family)
MPEFPYLESLRAPGGLEAFAPPIARLLGIRAVSADAGASTLELEADRRFANPMGTLHGGVLCDLADLAMGVALATTLREGETFTTLELKNNFMKPVWSGPLRGHARVKKAGRTTALVECEVRDGTGSLVAFATSTCMILRGTLAEGR